MDDRAGLEEVLRPQAQADEAESRQDLLQLGRVLLGRLDEDIDVARRPGVAVIGDGMPADDQVADFM